MSCTFGTNNALFRRMCLHLFCLRAAKDVQYSYEPQFSKAEQLADSYSGCVFEKELHAEVASLPLLANLRIIKGMKYGGILLTSHAAKKNRRDKATCQE